MNIKLTKGISYFYNGQTFEKDKPVVVDKETADYLLSTGHFVAVVEKPLTDDITSKLEEEATLPALVKMSLAELKALAKQLNVDVKSNAKKGDIIKAISSVQADVTSDDEDSADDVTADFEEED